MLSAESLAWFRIKCELSEVVQMATKLLEEQLGDEAVTTVTDYAEDLDDLISEQLMKNIHVDAYSPI